MRLSHQDFNLLQRAILALHGSGSVTLFKRTLPAILFSLIPADLFHLMEFRLPPPGGEPRLLALTDPSHQITPQLAAYVTGTLFEHPFPKYFAQTGDPTALKLSDFYTTTQLRGTEFYEHFYGPLGLRRQLTLPARLEPDIIGAVTLCRAGRDFTERDRLLLNLLRPHIELACRNANRLAAWQKARVRPLAAYHLTARETEIARWLVTGKTNPEIAIILELPVRTVEKHVEHILSKLGVENRTAAAVLIATSQPGKHAGCPPARTNLPSPTV